MTSTPSVVASSIACTLSVVVQPAPGSLRPQQTLYVAMRARGAMPLALPKSWPAMVTGTP